MFCGFKPAERRGRTTRGETGSEATTVAEIKGVTNEDREQTTSGKEHSEEKTESKRQMQNHFRYYPAVGSHDTRQHVDDLTCDQVLSIHYYIKT